MVILISAFCATLAIADSDPVPNLYVQNQFVQKINDLGEKYSKIWFPNEEDLTIHIWAGDEYTIVAKECSFQTSAEQLKSKLLPKSDFSWIAFALSEMNADEFIGIPPKPLHE